MGFALPNPPYVLPTHEGQTLIRPISARFMHAKEVKYYEETASKFTNR